ncbi:MAG: DNA methyltransferase [Bacteroidetes bacterium]|nr:DNA methyltransferase [Bacteroidota bacterium]
MKKLITPNQDIRFHRTDFKNGYSARSLDTQVTATFFKNHFPRYSNKETAFLTLATREKIPWTLKEGKNLKIRNEKLKKAFLEILNDVQVKKEDPEFYLLYFLFQLTNLSRRDEKIFEISNNKKEINQITNINVIISMFKEHFNLKYSSRLPVIAIYSAYQELMKVIKRYNNKILKPLNVHTSSDKHSFGDIEIYNKEGTPFEIIEIKHNLPIDRYMIFDILKKSKNTRIERYYILTTNTDNFQSKEEENFISELILKIKQEHNIEIIANGIIPSLKYYLRFVDYYFRFMDNYISNLVIEAKSSTEVNISHIKKWKELLIKYNIEKLK